MVTVSKPGVYLWRMIVFLTLIGFLSAILYSQIKTAFMSNPALNGMILAVLFIGTLYSFGQILRLYPEIRWINNFRFADPGNTKGSKAPTMLASMANMFRNQSGPFTLSTNVTSAILDSVGSRLDEARDTSRYPRWPANFPWPFGHILGPPWHNSIRRGNHQFTRHLRLWRRCRI